MIQYADITWTETRRDRVFSTRVFDLAESISRAPDGREASFNIIEARDWGIVVPVLESKDGFSFLMVRQWRHGSKCESIEFPGGVIERGEDPADGVRRELMEETGYRCEELELLSSMNPNPAIMANTVHIYLARGLSLAGAQDLDENEYLNVLTVPEKELILQNGKPPYIHAIMSAALGLWLQRRLQ